jgi:hypothetical protein
MEAVMKRIAMLVMFLLSMFPVVAAAQKLPANDPRNPAFLERFQEIVAKNSDIPNFYSMPPGTEYKLPEGGTEVLRVGDTHGIWGREFLKMYGIPYSQFLTTNQVPAPIPANLAADSGLATANTGTSDGIPWWMWVIVGLLLALIFGGILVTGDQEKKIGSLMKENEDLKTKADGLEEEVLDAKGEVQVLKLFRNIDQARIDMLEADISEYLHEQHQKEMNEFFDMMFGSENLDYLLDSDDEHRGRGEKHKDYDVQMSLEVRLNLDINDRKTEATADEPSHNGNGSQPSGSADDEEPGEKDLNRGRRFSERTKA